MARATKTTKKRQRAVKPSGSSSDTSWHARFLELLGSTCNVTLSARGAGVDRTTVYNHYKNDPAFAAAWDDAKESAIEELESEAWQRAKKQSDVLMIFLLKANRPEKYRETIRNEMTGANGGAIEVSIFEKSVLKSYGESDEQPTEAG